MSVAPPIWMIGDLQGCRHALDTLLEHSELREDPGARFWFAGDLVNRGPDSVGTLRKIRALGDRAVSVLGNHDLHLLAAAAGIKKPGKSDTIGDVLKAPDAAELIDWLRFRPLMHRAHGHILVHAGILPEWDADTAEALAGEVQRALRAPDWRHALASMYGNEPTGWDPSLTGGKRLRVVINSFTRMRMCDRHGHMDLTHKGPPEDNGQILPWFDVPRRAIKDHTIVFGHWSTLGLLIRPDVICLDTGCVWGRELTAMRLQDRKLVQIPCKQQQKPKT